MLMWLLLCWCLLSVPVGLVAVRCVAAAAGTPADVQRRRVDLGTTVLRRADAAPLPGSTTAPRAQPALTTCVPPLHDRPTCQSPRRAT